MNRDPLTRKQIKKFVTIEFIDKNKKHMKINRQKAVTMEKAALLGTDCQS